MDRTAVVRRRRAVSRSVVARTYPSLETLEERSLLSVPPIDVVGHLPPAEYNTYIANAVNVQGNHFKDWGNEPFVAVNPLHPNQIVVSSFAYGAYLFSPPPGDTRSSLWYSQDGGVTWGIRFPIISRPVPTEGVPDDQTFAYDSNGVLHGAFLTYGLTRTGPSLNIFHGTTTDPNRDGLDGRPATAWQWNTNHVNLPNPTQDSADQPWIAVSDSHVYVGYGYSHPQSSSIQSRVSASSDGGTTFTMDNPISNARVSYWVNSGIRLATDRVGNVYGLFATADPSLKEIKAGQPQPVHYRLNVSSDGGATWKFTESTREGGLVVDDGLSLQFLASFGGVNVLKGNITALAADPAGAHIYAAYGKEDATGTDRIYLAEFHPDPTGDLVERANPVALSVAGQRAALPSVAVTDDGTIAVQYDTFTPGDGQFHVHLATSADQGRTFTDQDLSDFSAAGIPFPSSNGNRLLGDYQGLIAVGDTVYGTFAARGNVNDPGTGIDTTDKIDPFFYSVTLPAGRLNSLAAVTPGAASTAVGGADTTATLAGVARSIGAALPDGLLTNSAMPSAGLSPLIPAPDTVGAGGTSSASSRARPQSSNATSAPGSRGTARLVPSGLPAGKAANGVLAPAIIRRQTPWSPSGRMAT
jgi:hypothetical protein